jgi:hypothetical protein
MRLLLDGRLAPITSTMGFLEYPAAEAAAGFLDWMRAIHEPLGRRLDERRVSGGLEEVLLGLLPLVSILRTRWLFIPTASPWCAFVDNGHQGTDAFSAMSFLAERLGCRGMRVTAVPDTIEGEFKGARGEYGAVVLEVYGPERTHFLNYQRSICALHDGDRWDFSAGGTPFPFEETERYRARRIRDRFTFDMLERYLRQLGLEPFEEDFYLPGPAAEAVLIEQTGTRPAGMREFGLEELR